MADALEVVRRMYAALRASDREAYRVLTHPGIEWHFAEGFPHGGVRVGQAAVFDGVFPALMRDFSEWDIEVDELIAAGETVVGLGRYRARARTSGVGLVAAFAHVFRVRDGRIVRVQQFTDTLQFARALAGSP